VQDNIFKTSQQKKGTNESSTTWGYGVQLIRDYVVRKEKRVLVCDFVLLVWLYFLWTKKHIKKNQDLDKANNRAVATG
jgi:hypothetical protein